MSCNKNKPKCCDSKNNCGCNGNEINCHCVTYVGETLSTIEVVEGDKLCSILSKIDEAIRNIMLSNVETDEELDCSSLTP